jgi:hypothetical protein
MVQCTTADQEGVYIVQFFIGKMQVVESDIEEKTRAHLLYPAADLLGTLFPSSTV